MVRSVTDASGNMTWLNYDAGGNLQSVFNDLGILVFFGAYNEYGEVTRTDGASVPTTYFDYDVSGNQVASWRFEGEGAGEVQILDLTFYDDAGQATGSARAVLPASDFVETDLATAQIDAEYVLWSNSTVYNAAGQIETTTDRFGLVSENTYDTRGQLVQTRSQSTDETGGTVWLVTRTVYDAAGRATHATNQYVEGTTDPIGGSVTTYDAAGRVFGSDQIENLQIGLVGTGGLVTSVVADIGATVSSSTTLYDTAGRTTISTDSFGNESRTTYNAHGDVIQTATQSTDENGQPVWLISRTIYDAHGRAVLSTDRFVGQASLPDDITGVPTLATRTVYDDLGRVKKTVRLEGAIVDVGQVSNLPETVLIAGGAELYSTETIYNAQGQVARSIAADGQTTDYEYDALGRRIATIGHAVPAASVGITPPAGATLVSLRSETIYNTDDDSDGRIESERTNVYQFDNGTIDDTAAQETSYEYDEHGNRTRTTFNDGSYILIRYDDFGRQTAEMQQTAASIIAEWSETENSFVIEGTSDPIPTKLYEYDAQGRLSAVELPAVAPSPDHPLSPSPVRPRYEYAYDGQGNQTLIRDPLNRETRFTFDGDGRQLTRTLPLGFGPDGIQGTGDDATLPEGDFTEHFEYDARGRQFLHVSFEGVVTEFIYDPTNGRLAEQRYFDDLTAYDNGTPTEAWKFTYDAFGREIEVVQDDGTNVRTTAKAYDERGNLVKVDSPEGVITYAYDNVGRKIESAVYAAGADPAIDTPERATSYTYDELGRLATVSEDLDPASTEDDPLDMTYGYELVGNLSRTDLPGGVIEAYSYDTLNRLDVLTHYAPDETPEDLSDNDKLAEFDYTVRADGKRTSVTETFWLDHDDDPETPATPHENQIDWTYDDIGRLTDEVFDHFDDALDQTEYFIYDLVGNRKSATTDAGNDAVVDRAIEYLYDANDRLLSEELDSDVPQQNGVEQTTTYGYDHTQQTRKTVVDEATSNTTLDVSFSYDLQGRMSEVVTETFSAGSVSHRERVTYDYDTTGIRVSSLHEIDADVDDTYESSTRTEFLVDHNNHTGYQQVIKETTYDGQGNVTKTIEYTIGHDEIAQTVTPYVAGNPDTANAQTHIFGHDGHGSVRVLYDMAGAIAQAFAYTAYGQLLSIHNGAAQFISASATDAQTTSLHNGEHFDANIQRTYLRARWYN